MQGHRAAEDGQRQLRLLPLLLVQRGGAEVRRQQGDRRRRHRQDRPRRPHAQHQPDGRGVGEKLIKSN